MRAPAARKALGEHALSLPGAWLDHPWGEDVVKVGKKIFVFLGRPQGDVGVGVKLSRSLLFAGAQPFVQKMGYGMDRSGWVAARFKPTDDVPVELLTEWIDESYEAIAPKPKAAKPRDRAASLSARRSGRSP